MNRSAAGIALSLLLLCGLCAWGVWLLTMRKSVLDYVVAAARVAPSIPDCQWMPVSAPAIASLGLSFDPGHAWTDRKQSYLAFRTDQLPAQVELKIAAIAARTLVSADGSSPERLSRVTQASGIAKLSLRPGTKYGVHTIAISVAHPQHPRGRELRWLGVAISAIRACGGGPP